MAYTHRDTLQTAQELPLIWAPALLAGCFLASATWLRVSGEAAMLALAVIVGLSFLPSAGTRLVTYVVVVPVIALLSCTLIINAASGAGVRLLRFSWLRWLGLISYGAYLWNYPISQWFGPWLSIPLTLAAAVASYLLIERRFLRKKRHGVALVDAVSTSESNPAESSIAPNPLHPGRLF